MGQVRKIGACPFFCPLTPDLSGKYTQQLHLICWFDGKAAKLVQSLKTGEGKEITMLLEGLHQKIRLQAASQQKTVFMKGKNGGHWDVNKIVAKGLNNLTKAVMDKSMQDDDMVIDMYQQRKGPRR